MLETLTRKASDSAAHMAEEVRDAGLTVPKAIITTFMINALLGLIMMVSFVFCVPSIDDALNDPTGYPFLYVLQLSMPVYGIICISVLMMVLMQVGNVSITLENCLRNYTDVPRSLTRPPPPARPLPSPAMAECHSRNGSAM